MLQQANQKIDQGREITQSKLNEAEAKMNVGYSFFIKLPKAKVRQSRITPRRKRKGFTKNSRRSKLKTRLMSRESSQLTTSSVSRRKIRRLGIKSKVTNRSGKPQGLGKIAIKRTSIKDG